MSNNVWFTSDNHYFHKNIIKYCNRPWTFEEQTEQLISRWNSRVGEYDDVYHLGDFAFASRKQYDQVIEIIKRLNGNIHFIRGNHCDAELWEMIERTNLPHVVWIKDYAKIRVQGQKVILSHYPFATWDSAHHGSWHLFGHCHGSFEGIGKSMDVGLDAHPEHQVFSWDEIRQKLAAKEYHQLDHHEKGER